MSLNCFDVVLKLHVDGNELQWNAHEFSFVKRCAEIEIFNIKSHQHGAFRHGAVQ